MPVGNRFYQAPKLSGIKSIVLPDGQQFFAPKLVNIEQSSAVLTLNLADGATAITYTATDQVAAAQLSLDIQQAVAVGGTTSVSLPEPAPIGDITITSVTPGSVGTLAAAGGEPVVIVGTNFLSMATPDFIFLIPIDSLGNPLAYFTDCVTVDDMTITATSSAQAAGAYSLALYDNVGLRAVKDITYA